MSLHQFSRDPRGFAIKFYTEHGIWDLVCNDTPVFFIRDPMLFPSFIHTQKRNPVTHLKVGIIKLLIDYRRHVPIIRMFAQYNTSMKQRSFLSIIDNTFEVNYWQSGNL